MTTELADNEFERAAQAAGRNSAELTTLAQDWTKLREEYDAASEQANKIGMDLKALEETILTRMEETGMENFAAHGRRFAPRTDRVVRVGDWKEFHKYIVEEKAPYLLQKRAHAGAVREHLEQTGELIPGAEIVDVTKLQITKRP